MVARKVGEVGVGIVVGDGHAVTVGDGVGAGGDGRIAIVDDRVSVDIKSARQAVANRSNAIETIADLCFVIGECLPC